MSRGTYRLMEVQTKVQTNRYRWATNSEADTALDGHRLIVASKIFDGLDSAGLITSSHRTARFLTRTPLDWRLQTLYCKGGV